jgi:Trk K+ transport system NAD-binding subunit
MAGRRDLQVVAVGENTEDLRGIARSLSELDIQIEDEELVQTEIRSPYEPFSPEDSVQSPGATDLLTLPDGTDVVEVVVSAAADVVGQSLDEARQAGVLNPETVVVSIERDGEILRPADETVIKADDVVTLLPRETDETEVLNAFVDRE